MARTTESRALRPAALLWLLLLALLPVCGRRPAPTSLRLAVLPVLDALPLYVAEAQGYFAAEGVAVTLVPVGAAAERDQLLQAGQVDGVITDLVALALYNRQTPTYDQDANEDGATVIAVRWAMTPTPEFAQFRILAAGRSGLSHLEELKRVPIGVSEGTIIEYVTERLLVAEGLPPEDVLILAVPRIAERMALLDAGELQAATLPEPLASLAVQQGAVALIDDRAHPDVSGSLFAFRADIVEARADEVRAFLRAIDNATATINADKPRWHGLLIDQQLIPAGLADSYSLPDYPPGGRPSPAQLKAVVTWLAATDRLEGTPPYATIVRDLNHDRQESQ